MAQQYKQASGQKKKKKVQKLLVHAQTQNIPLNISDLFTFGAISPTEHY